MYWWREAGLHTEILPGGGGNLDMDKRGGKRGVRGRVTMIHPKYSSGKS